VLTDKGTQFNAKFFLAVCRELGIEKLVTTVVSHLPEIWQTTQRGHVVKRTLLGARDCIVRMSQFGVGRLCRLAPHALPALDRLSLTGTRIEVTKLRPRRGYPLQVRVSCRSTHPYYNHSHCSHRLTVSMGLGEKPNGEKCPSQSN
jgi:hypothetical protein